MSENLKQFILYTAPNGEVRVDVLLQDEMLWLTQKAMALLFDCSTDNVSLHLKNIFESNELEENSVTEVFSATASDGKMYMTQRRCEARSNLMNNNRLLRKLAMI